MKKIRNYQIFIKILIKQINYIKKKVRQLLIRIIHKIFHQLFNKKFHIAKQQIIIIDIKVFKIVQWF